MSLIYHFTSVDAFLGMLKDFSTENKNLKMWATSAMFLNDPSEYEYGKEVSRNLLREIEDELEIDEKERLSNHMYSGEMKNFFTQLEKDSSSRPKAVYDSIPYVISFSLESDILPMWTSYGKNGNGIAIGINREALEQHLDSLDDNQPFTIRNCYYDCESNEWQAIKNSIKYQYELMLQIANGGDEGIVLVKQIDIIRLLNNQLSPFIKHEGYRYEREVRGKVYKAKEIKFRESRGSLIPYVEVDIPISCIEKIIIGPTADAERMRISLEILMRSRSIGGNIEIVSSEIPYRG